MISAETVAQGMVPAGAALPAVTWIKVSHMPGHSHAGFSGLSAIRVQTDIWAMSEPDREELLAELRAGLDGFSGQLGGPGGIYCGSSRIINIMDTTDPDAGWLRTTADFILGIND